MKNMKVATSQVAYFGDLRAFYAYISFGGTKK